MPAYPHKLTISRGGAGSQDLETGAWTPGEADTILYTGVADIFDPNAGNIWQRMNEGLEQDTESWRAYLSDNVSEAVLRSLKEGDQALVTWENGDQQSFLVSGTNITALVVLLREG
jgi:hypothetical protein